ncbi:MAG: SMP-30/gluconolactonase/LRE family protein [Bacteroidota bacterium]
MKNQLFLLLLVGSLCWQCTESTSSEEAKKPAIEEPSAAAESAKSYLTTGAILRKSPELDQYIEPGTLVEIVGEGFEWSEGPVWVPALNALLFSDVPQNKIYKWTEAKGIEDYLSPSGYTDSTARGGETGSNGLLLNTDGKLVLCQHGDKRLATLEAPFDQVSPIFSTITDRFEGKRYNSPNDVCQSKSGAYYFTDPPYGLAGGQYDTNREIEFQGVYKVVNGKSSLVTDQLSRPNGIALAPDQKVLYVANSDPEYAVWMKFVLDENEEVTKTTVFHNATKMVGRVQGLPDGLKVHSSGVIFASGPGGVWIFKPDGTQLGTIRLDQACSNVALQTDESALYITADHQLLRVKLK